MNQVPPKDGSINNCSHIHGMVLEGGKERPDYAWKRLRALEVIQNPREHFDSKVLEGADDVRATSCLFICEKCREVRQVIELRAQYVFTTQVGSEPKVPTRELDKAWEQEQLASRAA